LAESSFFVRAGTGWRLDLREGKVTEKDTHFASASVAFERLREMAHDPSPTKAEAVSRTETKPLAVRPEIEIVRDLLAVARMACSDLSPDAKSALGTLLMVTAMLCEQGRRIETDVQNLIKAASMACAELPAEKGGALRTLLRVASQKLSEVGSAAPNGDAPVYDLPGRTLRPGFEH
jgi:hypothetical protein